MPAPLADETHTVRLPKGVANQIRAATGQKFSTLVRWTMLALLERYKNQQLSGDTVQDIRKVVSALPAEDSTNGPT